MVLGHSSRLFVCPCSVLAHDRLLSFSLGVACGWLFLHLEIIVREISTTARMFRDIVGSDVLESEAHERVELEEKREDKHSE